MVKVNVGSRRIKEGGKGDHFEWLLFVSSTGCMKSAEGAADRQSGGVDAGSDVKEVWNRREGIRELQDGGHQPFPAAVLHE